MTTKPARTRHAPEDTHIVVRSWQGEDDLEAIASVMSDSMAADGIDINRNVDEVRNFLTRTPNLNPGLDTVLVERDGELVAYGDASWIDENTGERVYRADMYVLPDFRESDLPAVLFGRLHERLEIIAAAHVGVDAKVLHVSLGKAEHRLRALVEGQGFEPQRTFYRMVRPDLEAIPDLPLPSGLDVREARPEHFRKIYEAMEEAFQDHWGSRPMSDEGYQLWVNDPVAKPDLWQVAWDGDEVAGMVLNIIDEDENRRYDRARGYTEDICVRRPWRRRGLAKALIARSLSVLADAGMEEAALGVDADNQSGALTLYTDMGYETRWTFFAYRKPFLLSG